MRVRANYAAILSLFRYAAGKWVALLTSGTVIS